MSRRRRTGQRYTRGNYENQKGSRVAGDLDPVAVQRYVDGDHSIRLTLAERRAAIDVLDERGYSIHQAAETLGFCCRTIVRRRAQRRRESETK